jgi:hypothetical protein
MNYKKIYDNLITRTLERGVPMGYSESHHIVPKCMGGGDEKTNLVRLTAREHFLAHMLLCNIYPNNVKLSTALFCMCNQQNNKMHRYTPSSKEYARIKEQYTSLLKDANLDSKRRKRISESMKGIPLSMEHKLSLSASMKKPKNATHKEILKNFLQSEEVKQKRIDANLGSFWVTNGEKNIKAKPNSPIPNGYWKGRVMKQVTQI